MDKIKRVPYWHPGCCWYVEPDGSYSPAEYSDDPEHHGRIYGNLYGASHVGVPVTAIAKIERVAMYDGMEALANDFKLEGLTPCNHIVVVTLEE